MLRLSVVVCTECRVNGPISGHDHLMATFDLLLFYHAALFRWHSASYFGLWYCENSYVTPPLRSRDLKLCLRWVESETDARIILLQYYRGVHFSEVLFGARYV